MIRKDAYSIHEQLDGAKMKATIYSAPINYKDENNEWKEIVTDLDSKVNWETEYCVEKNNFKTYFNDMTDMVNPTLASFEYEGKWINYKMVDAEPEEIIVDKSKILWREVKPYIDLEYEVTSTKLKENIIIKHEDGLDDLEFTIKTNANFDNFNIELFAKDSDGNIGEVDYILTTNIYDNVEYESILLLPNEDFLNNAVYPIVIDPTTTLKVSDGNGRVAGVRSDTPDTSYVNQVSVPMTGDNPPLFYMYIKFDLSSLGVISSAQVRVYQSDSEDDILRMYKVTSAWTSPTYNNQPTHDSTLIDSDGVTSGNRWREFDITDTTDITDNGFFFSSGSVDYTTYTGYGETNEPQLVAVYTISSPDLTSPTSTISTQPTILTDTIPNITWDIDYDRSAYQVEVYKNDDDTLINDSGKITLSMVQSSSYSYTVSSALNYDTVYKCRLRVWDNDDNISDWGDYYYFVIFENEMYFYGNSIIDRVKVVDYTMTASEISALAISDEVDWDDDTLFLANFEQTLDGGNILNLSSELTGFKVTRTEVSDGIFSTIDTLGSDETTYEDFEIYPNKNYKYRIHPITATEVGDAMETSYIESDLEAWYISNQATGQSYKIDCNLQSSVIQNMTDFTQYKTFTQFPAFSFGSNDYMAGSISGVLDLDTNVTTLDAFQAFINDGQEKILKSRKGDAWKVITHTNTRKYWDDVSEQITTISFNFVQVGEV